MMKKQTKQQKTSKKTIFHEDADRVTRALRQEIYSGLRLPRERLVEVALAEAFSVSRMVIRQVLNTLKTEGLVEIEPYKGASVASISVERIFQNYQVLAMLEGFAAKLAAEKMKQKDLNRLKKLLEGQKKLDEANIKDWHDLNQSFHRVINLKSENKRLIQMIGQHMKFTTYWFLLLSAPGRILKNIDDHKKVIEAFEKQDGERARLVMERHILGAGEYLTKHLQRSLPAGMLG